MNTSILTVVCATRLFQFKTSLVLIVAALLGALWFTFRNPGGIHDDEHGQAVYLEGEACTVNYTPDPALFQARLDWCAAWYRRDRAHPH